MKFTWDPMKNIQIKQDPGRNEIGFEDIIDAIESGHIIDIINNPNQDKYPDQNIFIINIQGYIYHVPYRMDGDDCHLITIYPSRKSTKKHL